MAKSGAYARVAHGRVLALDVTRPYRPQEKGKVDRLHRTLKDTLPAGPPHFTGGPRAANGQLEAPDASAAARAAGRAVRRLGEDDTRALEENTAAAVAAVPSEP